jgi:mono/diheme cytochrome c family protein
MERHRTILPILAAAILFGTVTAAPASESYVPPPETQKKARVTTQSLVSVKCTKCHTLERVDKARKSAAQWKTTVDAMAAKSPGWISAQEADAICRWLAGRNLTEAKCAKCHDVGRADVMKTVTQWGSTLDRMQGKDPKWFTDEEKGLIKSYLTDIYLLELD